MEFQTFEEAVLSMPFLGFDKHLDLSELFATHAASQPPRCVLVVAVEEEEEEEKEGRKEGRKEEEGEVFF